MILMLTLYLSPCTVRFNSYCEHTPLDNTTKQSALTSIEPTRPRYNRGFQLPYSVVGLSCFFGHPQIKLSAKDLEDKEHDNQRIQSQLKRALKELRRALKKVETFDSEVRPTSLSTSTTQIKKY